MKKQKQPRGTAAEETWRAQLRDAQQVRKALQAQMPAQIAQMQAQLRAGAGAQVQEEVAAQPAEQVRALQAALAAEHDEAARAATAAALAEARAKRRAAAAEAEASQRAAVAVEASHSEVRALEEQPAAEHDEAARAATAAALAEARAKQRAAVAEAEASRSEVRALEERLAAGEGVQRQQAHRLDDGGDGAGGDGDEVDGHGRRTNSEPAAAQLEQPGARTPPAAVGAAGVDFSWSASPGQLLRAELRASGLAEQARARPDKPGLPHSITSVWLC